MPNLDDTPLQLYIHVPFCERKCHYCDFASWELPALRQRDYAAILEQELIAFAPSVQGRKVKTVFFGGGTPSVLHSDYMRSIVTTMRRHYDCGALEEMSLEANPSSINSERIDLWKDLGFDRVSMGVQSFDPEELTRLGRVHSEAKAHEALALLVESGLRFSGDLIFGLPKQGVHTFIKSLNTMLEYNPSHISFYGLTVEEGTEFDRQARLGELILPDGDQYADLYETGVERLADHGLNRYEVSNFARPGQECRHNIGYWTFADYLGFGPGAHGRLNGIRRENPHAFEDYLDWGAAGFPESKRESENPQGDSLATEVLFLGLRQSGGFSRNDLLQRTGLIIPNETLEPLLQKGLLVEKSKDRLVLGSEGYLVLDAVVTSLAAKLRQSASA